MIKPQFEYVQAEEGSSFRCVYKTCDDLAGDHPWHFHPEFELSWVMTSHGTRYVGDYVQPYAPGEVVLYGPNLPHCSRNDGGSGEPVEHITIQFIPACLGQDFFEIPEATSIKRLLEESRGAVMFAPTAAALVGPLMMEIEQLSGMSRLVKLIEVLDRLSRVERRALITPSYTNQVVVDQKLVERLAHVQRYIDEHFRGIVRQAELAGQLDMSAPAFSKFVRSATGNTFMGLVKLARINEACRLLANGSERITDIALDSGYQHTSHFDRHFRELKGVSPSDYRRKLLALSDDTHRESVAPMLPVKELGKTNVVALARRH